MSQTGKVTSIRRPADPIKLGRQLAVAKPDDRRPLERRYRMLSWQDQLKARAEMARCRQAMRGQILAEVV
jgi:hypothetical protein